MEPLHGRRSGHLVATVETNQCAPVSSVSLTWRSLFVAVVVVVVGGGGGAVSKLREHWEETAAAVAARKNQLEALLSDSNQFERRRQDVDQWLSRMEARLSKLAPVAGTADLIETQHREQKVRKPSS